MTKGLDSKTEKQIADIAFRVIRRYCPKNGDSSFLLSRISVEAYLRNYLNSGLSEKLINGLNLMEQEYLTELTERSYKFNVGNNLFGFGTEM
jgi:hypothetical protein